MAQSYIHANFINGYFDYFKIPYEDLDGSHPWIKSLLNAHKQNYMPDSRITTYQSMARMQKMALGLTKFDSIPIDTLSIKGYFERK